MGRSKQSAGFCAI